MIHLDLGHNSFGLRSLKKLLKLGKLFTQTVDSQFINLHCCPLLYKPIPAPIYFLDIENSNYGLNRITKQFLLSLCESPKSELLLPELKLSLLQELSDPIFTQMLQSKLFKEDKEGENNNTQTLTIKSIDISFTNIGPMSIRMLADT